MQPILIRGLSRSFTIEAGRIDASFAALRTTPDLPGTEPASEAIVIEPLGLHYRVRFPSGRTLEGSLRDCISRVDRQILHQAVAVERNALVLPAAIVRAPDEKRIALVGGPRTGKTWISLALLARGWCIEGDGWAVVRPEGAVALPRTIRIRQDPAILPASLRGFAQNAPLLLPGAGMNEHAVDPRCFGSPWRLPTGPLASLAFLDRNSGGLGAIAPLDRDTAFRRALTLRANTITGPGAVALRVAITAASSYRLQVGCPERAAERLIEAWLGQKDDSSHRRWTSEGTSVEA